MSEPEDALQTELPQQQPSSARACAGCGKSGDRGAFLRVVLADDGSLLVDLQRSSVGRGANVHADPTCVQRGLRGGFARTFRAEVVTTVASFRGLGHLAVERRLRGLLVAARRKRALAVGADAARELALREAASRGARAVVANDAGSIARERFVLDMVTNGAVIVAFRRGELGALLGRPEVSVCATSDVRIAKELDRLRALQMLFSSLSSKEGA
jgi:predicted RNA-binding protein YlxR (DUF448 family)